TPFPGSIGPASSGVEVSPTASRALTLAAANVSPVDTATAKDALRERMRRARAAIPPSERAVLAARVEARLLALPELRDARTVLLFYSFGTEVPTAVLA